MPELIRLIILAVILLFSAFTDIRSHRIPNIVTFPGMAAALILYAITSGADGFLFCITGIAAGIGLMLVPYVLGGMGAGDAKLMGAVGGFLGAKGVLGAFLLTAVAGGMYALLTIFFYRSLFKNYIRKFYQRFLTFAGTHVYIPESNESKANRPKLCYGLAIALGTVSYLLINFMGYHFLS